MEEKFQKYTLLDFLDDVDFCEWARSERPDLDVFYKDFIKKYPKQKSTFQKAHKLINLFDDEKLRTDPTKKLQIWEEINRTYRKQRKIVLMKSLLRYAAIIVVFFSISSLAWYFLSFDNQENEFISSYDIKDYTETKLILDNEQEIDVPTDKSEIVYQHGGEKIVVNNEVVAKTRGIKETEANQLIVPFGKQAKVVLADHTEVWLNAGSKLIYPSKFEKDKRVVQLQGEAFLKVSKDKTKPFVVETSKSKIKVLGTTFNVKAYPDENTEETVLVEGSVSVNLGSSIFRKEIIIEPDQRIVVSDADNSYSITEVQVDDYTSWIDGLFAFNGEPLTSVLRRISRFYDIQIRWSSEVENKRISGKLDLKEDSQRVLKALSLISNGNYREENGIVIFKMNE